MLSNSQKIDPRVKRTRQLLLDALLALLDEKRFEQISIGEITTRANVNRTTFYSHFEDKYQLFLFLVTEMLDKLIVQVDLIENDPQHSAAQDIPAPLIVLFEQIGSHANLYRNVFGKGGDAAIETHIRSYMEEMISRWLNKRGSQTQNAEIPPAVVSRYIASARLGVIEWWLDNRQPCSARQIAQWVWDLTKNPVIEF